MSIDPVKPSQIALLAGPSQQQRDALIALERTAENHEAALASLACLQRLEAPVSVLSSPLRFPLTVAAWNLERCYNVEKTADMLRSASVDVALLSEVDNGMDRTGQRHTSREIAEQLGMTYAYGVEFLELEAGNAAELEYCADGFNAQGFHGNALLAKSALQAPVMVRLPDQLFWFNNEVSARIGSRCAIAAGIMTEQGPLYAVSVHLESRGDAAHRGAQMHLLFETIDSLCGDAPVIIGGDLNTGLADGGDFDKETLFEEANARRYSRHSGRLDQMTTRASRISRTPKRAYKLDWILTRGVQVAESRIVPSVVADGEVLSDHDMVVARITGLDHSVQS